MRLFSWLRIGCGVLAAGLVSSAARAATWYPLGPFGGDARALAVDPADSNHLFLGTATGWVYDSHDGGGSWTRVAQIAKRNDLVIVRIVVDAQNPKRLMVAAYTVDRPSGGVFISEDYGKNWYSQAEMRGQSVRSLARSASNPRELVAGTLTGVFRSMDNGTHWKQISPEGNAEIHEVESVAIDPADPNVIYAGTWHLPWKTTDGGATWANIKEGIIDDSDVFSIIVDPQQPSVVYASACSGIYKSSDAGTMFHKVQGIPSTARRTRKLAQDPEHLDTVFAGTTEGLYRSLDAGVHWDRLTPADLIVNDVYVDPANSNHVLIATDRGGVYRSEDGGTTFDPSNQGFSARQVTAYTADAQNANTVYVGVVNDKTTGGVFQSVDGGVKWKQQSEGLGGRDVFSLLSLGDGTLLAGTGHGIFRLQDGTWADSSAMDGAPAVLAPKKPATAVVRMPAPRRLNTATARANPARARAGARSAKGRRVQVKASRGAGHGHAAASRLPAGRRSAASRGRNTKGAHLVMVKGHPRETITLSPAVARRPSPPAPAEVAVASKPAQAGRLDGVVYSMVRSGDVLFAGSSTGLLRSADAGQHWSVVTSLAVPDVHFVSVLADGKEGMEPQGGATILAASLQGLALSSNGGEEWAAVPLPPGLTQIGAVAIDGDRNLWVGGREGVWLSSDQGATWKTLRNLFLTEVNSIYYDPAGKRLLVTSSGSPAAFSVSIPDQKVTYWDTGWKLRFVRPVGGHLIGATLFDGVVVQPQMVDSPAVSAAQALQ